MTKLTTHVLDTMSGTPAENLRIDLYGIGANGEKQHLLSATTNADGRVDNPLLQGDNFQLGDFELVFHAGAYLSERDQASDFLDLIPIRFKIADLERHYHVPLLLSAYGYSTYRGS